jgi:hypothetical protein
MNSTLTQDHTQTNRGHFLVNVSNGAIRSVGMKLPNIEFGSILIYFIMTSLLGLD